MECLSGGLEVEAFSGSVIVFLDDGIEVAGSDGVEVGFSWQVSSEASDGVFDAAFLPRGVFVTEEGRDADCVVECELSTIVHGQGLAQWRRQGVEEVAQVEGGCGCLAVFGVLDERVAGCALRVRV